jgi:hypothetical protein
VFVGFLGRGVALVSEAGGADGWLYSPSTDFP